MTTTLDRTKRVTVVGGRAPLRYLQDGAGFDAQGQYLGEFTAQGEPIGDDATPGLSSPVTDAQIRDAVAALDPDNPEHFTETGRPRIGAVRERLGYAVAVKVLNDALREG